MDQRTQRLIDTILFVANEFGGSLEVSIGYSIRMRERRRRLGHLFDDDRPWGVIVRGSHYGHWYTKGSEGRTLNEALRRALGEVLDLERNHDPERRRRLREELQKAVAA